MENLALIAAVVATGLAMVGVLIATIFWTREEANAVRKELSDDRKDLVSLINQIRLDIKDEIHAIHLEMKDFHGRLCAIEERRKNG